MDDAMRVTLGFLLASLLAAAPAAAKVSVRAVGGDLFETTFSFAPPIAVSSVAVAGSFNDWKKEGVALKDDGAGVYQTALRLAPGRYTYKFVLNGELWMEDPDNSTREPDGFTGFNAVVVVGRLGTAVPAQLGDGQFAAEALGHPHAIEYCEFVPQAREAVLRARTAQGDAEEGRLWVDDETSPRALERVFSRDGYDVWESLVEVSSVSFTYAFEFRDAGQRLFLGPEGPTPDRSRSGAYVFDLRTAPSLSAPGWAADSVFYQIFPDRFYNGDPSNDPPDVQLWGSTPTITNFMGGDLKGVLEKLPDLAELGVNALYFNPVFASPSNHKYDTADYLKIDPHLGDDAVFAELMRAAHDRGMRVILDGVFNHSGDRFWAFQDLVKNQQASQYAGWYAVRSFPVDPSTPTYECWWNFGHLPKLDTGDPGVREYLMGVGEHWLKAGADGWRLDVPNEVPHPFWREFRQKMRRAKPEAYIVGEIWSDGLPWLGGDEFDAVMNYVFRSAVLGYFASGKLGLKEFDEQLSQQRHRYPKSSLPVQFNLLGSHDTERVATVFGEDWERLKLAVLFQMTYLGAPVIYYGDEVGLTGGKDPECRKAFPWDPSGQNADLRAHYRKLLRLRRDSPELRRGSFRTVLADAARDVYAFSREYGKFASVVVLHRGAGTVPAEFELPRALARFPELVDALSGATFPVVDGRVTVQAGPEQGLILKPSEP